MSHALRRWRIFAELEQRPTVHMRLTADASQASGGHVASSHESEELQQRIKTLRLQLEEEQALRAVQAAKAQETEAALRKMVYLNRSIVDRVQDVHGGASL